MTAIASSGLYRVGAIAVDGVADGTVVGAVVAGWTEYRLAAGGGCEGAGVAVVPPAGGAGQGAGLERGFLGVGAVFDPAAARAVKGEARGLGGGERGGVEGDAQAVVAHEGMEAVVGGGAVALNGEVEEDGLGRAEELEHLVDQVGAEVVPQSGARACAVAPAVGDLGTKAVHAGFELNRHADGAGGKTWRRARKSASQRRFWNTERTRPRWRRGPGGFGLSHGEGERLVDHDMLTRCQRLGGQRGVSIVGGGDDDEVDGRVGAGLGEVSGPASPRAEQRAPRPGGG